MVYDNTKFHAAFDAWLDQNVEVGFGEHYGGDLLDDFCEFCRESGMMKRSPGRVVFGRRLREKGFDRRKSLGLTHWSGLALLKPRLTKPKRYKKTVDDEAEAIQERERIRLRDDFKKTPEGRKEFLDHFRDDMAEEERRLKELEDV